MKEIAFGDAIEDKTIIDGLFSGEETSLQLLQSKYSKYILYIANNILGDTHQAEECVNDVYHAVWKSIPPNCPEKLSAYSGKTIISAFTAKKSSDAGPSWRGEIDAVLGWCFDEENWKSKAPYESEKLLKVVRDNFTAVLLVCDDKTGNPDKLYSVNGSFGGLLSIDKNGDLVWQTENIVNSGYSPATSSFTIVCDCKNIEYTFETESGKVNKRETDETSSYKF